MWAPADTVDVSEGLAQMARLTGDDMEELINSIEIRRRAANLLLDPTRRVELGQYMTPATVARSLATAVNINRSELRLLDPGAGVGSLTAAVVERIISSSRRPAVVHMTCYEIDPILRAPLIETLEECTLALRGLGIATTYDVFGEDFLEAALGRVTDVKYTAAILNPPFKKLPANAVIALRIRARGWSSANLYTAFWCAAIDQVEQDGDIVAITPRSFCNGTYFRGFRRFLLKETALASIHVFETRDQAFSEDGVLQETVITHSVRGARPNLVELAISRQPDGEASRRLVPHADVVYHDDPAAFIRLPIDDGADAVSKWMSSMPSSLESLGISVSTGPVVDFRSREHLRNDPEPGTAPLLYPTHLADGRVQWPLSGGRKPNAFLVANASRMLIANGHYTFVKRFSAKEERRRVVASYYDGGLHDSDNTKAQRIAVENHLNYFHNRGEPLVAWMARGLTLYLNSTMVDQYFRQFNGHTQVNAGDLRSLRYPSQAGLELLSQSWKPGLTQAEIDEIVEGQASGALT